MCYKILIPRPSLGSKLWSSHTSVYPVRDTQHSVTIKMEWEKPLKKKKI